MEYSIQCTCIKIQQQLQVSKKNLKLNWFKISTLNIYILALKSSYKHAYIVYVYRSRVNTFLIVLI